MRLVFGRGKSDDDPFAALREGGTYQSSPVTVPDVVPEIGLGAEPEKAAATMPPPSVSAPVARPPRRRRTYGFTGIGAATVVRLAILAVVIGAIAIPLISVGNAVHSISVPSLHFNPGSGPVNASPAPPQVSYLKPAGVRAGLARIAKLAPGARLSLLRLDANSLSATATFRNGTAKQIYFGPTGTTITSGAVNGERSIALAQIRPNAVARLVAEMGRRFHVAPNRIDYMVISSPPGLPAMWIVFSKAPSHPGFSAPLSGGSLTRLGG